MTTATTPRSATGQVWPDLGETRIAILATDGFEQAELTVPLETLEQFGATVDVVSPEPGAIRGWNEVDWGDVTPVTHTLDEADTADYAALVLPGGVINPDRLRLDADAVDFIRTSARAETPIAAICHAGWLLVEAGLARGRRLTSYPSIRTDMVNAGAEWVDEAVVRDGRLITSRRPDDLEAFCRVIVDVLVEEGSSSGAAA